MYKIQDTFVPREMRKCKLPSKIIMVYPRLYSDYYELRITKGGCPLLIPLQKLTNTHPVLRKKVETTILAWKINWFILSNKELLQENSKQTQLILKKTAFTIIALIEAQL